MSTTFKESFWSFDFSKSEQARRVQAASSSGDSHPSPGTSVKAVSPPQRPPRPPTTQRVVSDQRLKERIRIQAIGEGGHRAIVSSARSPLSHSRKTRSSGTEQQEQLSEGQNSSSLPPTPLSEHPPQSLCESTGSESTPGHASVSSTRRATRPGWSRTRSGGVWYKQQKPNSQDSDSLPSIQSAAARSGQEDSAIISVVPLKPPPSPSRLQTVPTHHIVVEKPFGVVEGLRQIRDSVSSTSTKPPDSQRRSSLDVRLLFSAPLFAFRKKPKLPALASPIAATSSVYSPVTIRSTDLQGHRSLPKREQTALTLARVSALLEGGRTPFMARIKSWKRKSPSSTGSSNKNESRQSAGRQIGTTFTVFKNNHSAEHLPSATSSILELQMGETPQNSPAREATYKIKRSPSAETEEFLKIDISIRGETSYLPSEARRIHTPPLPGDTPAGKVRGYFFDYNDPSLHDACEHSITTPQHDPNALKPPSPQSLFRPPTDNQLMHRVATKLNIPGLTTRSPTMRPLLKSPTSKSAPKAKTGEWFESRLKELDTSTSSLDVTSPQYELDKRREHKRECQKDLAEIKRQTYQAQLDQSIPEHLPSSPLCPRNPRYWRVVKSKGSQFRGCWMHGYGEYDVVPGLVKGGAVA